MHAMLTGPYQGPVWVHHLRNNSKYSQNFAGFHLDVQATFRANCIKFWDGWSGKFKKICWIDTEWLLCKYGLSKLPAIGCVAMYWTPCPQHVPHMMTRPTVLMDQSTIKYVLSRVAVSQKYYRGIHAVSGINASEMLLLQWQYRQLSRISDRCNLICTRMPYSSHTEECSVH